MKPRKFKPKPKPWQRVKKVVRKADVILEVVDARFPEPSKKLRKIAGKKPVLVIVNKIDLVSKEKERELRKLGLTVSAKYRKGKRLLLKLLKSYRETFGREIRICVVGRPNVGKSSLINMLKGRKSALTSPEAGFTKGEQWFRIAPGILLIDTPGVIPSRDSEEILAIKNEISPSKLRDPVKAALKLFELFPEVKKALNLPEDDLKALEEFARRRGRIKQGGELNLEEAARILLILWQRGKINLQ